MRQHGSTNWIKVQKQTPEKPAIRRVARACNVSIGDAFLAWFRVWAWLDDQTADGFVPYLAPADVDDIGRLQGLGKCLADHGWMFFDDTGCVVRDWERHNGTSSKRRAIEAERQARHRDKCHANTVTDVTKQP